VRLMEPAAAIRTVFEDGWNRGDFSRLDGVLAGEIVHHSGGTSRAMSLEDLESVVKRWRTGFPDLEFELHAVVASAETGAAHLTLRGTHEGLWGGLEPTGKRIEVEHMFFFRFDEGRIAEVWELLDRSALRSQLGG